MLTPKKKKWQKPTLRKLSPDDLALIGESATRAECDTLNEMRDQLEYYKFNRVPPATDSRKFVAR